MPTVKIEGFNYGSNEAIDLTINWYVYKNGQNQPFFHSANISSGGGYAPDVFLINDNGFVSIFLKRGSVSQYCQNFRVRTWLRADGGGGSNSSWFTGWTASVVNALPMSNNVVTVQYKNKVGRLTAHKIGIGKTPVSSLDVVGGDAGADIANFTRLLSTGNPSVTVTANNGDPVIRFDEKGAAGKRFSIGVDNSNNSFNISEGTKMGQNDLVVLRDGTIGFGTASLNSLWQSHYVFSHSGNTGISIESTTGNNSTLSFISSRQGNPGYSSGATMIYEHTTDNFILRSAGAERLRITKNGSVGIGTTTIPTGYKLAINGHAIAEKVVIRKNTNWPDYVFEDSYQLPNLSDIESYVKKNQHLPEIPSASEIEENGQDLGEMNKLLLKKIEELTLYLIEERKTNDAQQREIDELKRNYTNNK
jgi:hypothetical protein